MYKMKSFSVDGAYVGDMARVKNDTMHITWTERKKEENQVETL